MAVDKRNVSGLGSNPAVTCLIMAAIYAYLNEELHVSKVLVIDPFESHCLSLFVCMFVQLFHLYVQMGSTSSFYCRLLLASICFNYSWLTSAVLKIPT
jgi:hypothetical protein